MNPRDFCAERRYEIACLLTYSFDPLFFEKVPLRALWAGGSGEILVVADRGEIADCVSRALGHLHHLGRSYRLVAADVAGRQHAKLILRIGDAGALVWVGSGNLTYGGWGGNDELSTAWKVEPADIAGVALVRSLVRDIQDMVPSDARAVLHRALDKGWLASSIDDAAPGTPLVLSGDRGTLSSLAAARWAGRRFDRVLIRTGSTDREGRFLRWAAETFGVREAVIALDAQHCSFDVAALAGLPCDVRLVPSDVPRYPHAKLYYFEGSGGDAAIVGSPNCSAAAWLLPASRNGNIEMAVFYDQCKRADFANALQPLLQGERLEASQVPNLGSLVTQPLDTAGDLRPALTELAASLSLGRLRARLGTPASPGATGELHFDGMRVKMTSDGEGAVWSGGWAGPPRPGTLFGTLVLQDGNVEVHTASRWLDDEDELLHATRGRQISDPLRRLGSASTSSEQNQVLQDLAWISRQLLQGRSTFPDPCYSKPPEDDTAPPPPPLVDPDQLVQRIADVEFHHTSSHSGSWGLPIFGVMRALFPDEQHKSLAPVVAGDDPDDNKGDALSDGPSKDDRDRTHRPKEAIRTKLQRQMEQYFERLAELEFMKTTTATQLVQAMSYPLAVAALGVRGGWVRSDAATDWIVRVCDLLFRQPACDGSKRHGLLESVRERFGQAGNDRLFADVVGDGTLWVALVGALGAVSWNGPHARLARALSLRDAFRCESLFARAAPVRLRDLLARLSITDAGEGLLQEAGRVSGILDGLEGLLTANDAVLRTAQKDQSHMNGDPLFRAGVGFASARESAETNSRQKLYAYLRIRAAVVKVVADYYINVRLAAATDQRIAAALREL